MEDSAGLGTVRYLKTLVTAMTVTTILGLIVLITVVVMKFSQATPSQSALPLPDQITLPEGVSADAVTMGQGWIAVVSGDEILIFNSADGSLRKRVSIR